MSKVKQAAAARAEELLKSYSVKLNPDAGTYRLVNKTTGQEENVERSGVDVGTGLLAKGRRANRLIGKNLVQASTIPSQSVQQPAIQAQTKPSVNSVNGERESYTSIKRRPATTLTQPQSFSKPTSLVIRPLPTIDYSKLTSLNNELKSELSTETEAENKLIAEDDMFNKFLQEQYTKLPEYRRRNLTPEEYNKYSGYTKTSPEFTSYSKHFDSQKKLLAKPISTDIGPTHAQQTAREFIKRIFLNPMGLAYPIY